MTSNHLPAHRGLTLCTTCGRIRGAMASDPPRVQLCQCEYERLRRDDLPLPERWDGFDINTFVELCHCCGVELLRSGSKWSVWFCVPCKRYVLALNRAVGHCVIPIGRHSLMAGIGISGSDIPDPIPADFIEPFWNATLGLFASIDRLSDYQPHLVQWTLDDLGLDPTDAEVDLGALVEAARTTHVDKRAAFERLIDYWNSEGPS
ncbi:MAG TPA: hypothetical protein VMZ66_07585 [Aeromicrobium sp.]|nr:hypothetical protein [Aeromicrobium sp.]